MVHGRKGSCTMPAHNRHPGMLARQGMCDFRTHLKGYPLGNSLVIQQLRLCAPNAGSLGSIPGHRTRSHVSQLRVCMLKLKILNAQQRLKILCAATKTRHSQIDKYLKNKGFPLVGRRTATGTPWKMYCHVSGTITSLRHINFTLILILATTPKKMVSSSPYDRG